MTDHLPECPIRQGEEPCVCPELRACEKRVRDEEDRMVPIIRRNEFQRGLDAARDAVAALADATPDYHTLTDALAAIDALRGDA